MKSSLGNQNATDIFSVQGSRFGRAIKHSLQTQTYRDSLFSFFLYVNLLAFVVVFLAMNGLAFSTITTIILIGYIVLSVNLGFERLRFSRHSLAAQRPIISTSLRYFGMALGDFALALVLFFSVAATPSAPPLITVLAVLIASLATLALAHRSIIAFLIGKGVLFTAAAIYIIATNNGNYNNLSVVFPIIIAYVLLGVMAYWLYLRHIRQLHQKFQQEYLHKQLEREQALRKRLFLYVGHDLRQPINALGMLLHSAPEQNEMITDAKQCVRSSKRLIDDIVQIATYQGDHIVVNKERIELNRIMQSIEREYSGDALAAGCELRIVNSSASVNNDFQLVSRTIKNFVVNAITHAPGSKILVGVRRRPNAIEIQVVDQGPGIAEEEQATIFKEFSQGENGNKENGFGLGLTIAKHFAKVCDGEIILKSKLGSGTLIGLRLSQV